MFLRKLTLSVLLFLAFLFSGAQDFTEKWARTAGGTGTDSGTAVVVNNHGGVFIAGNFRSTTFTIGNTTLTNAGGSDIFLAKYDTAGNFLWATKFGGPGNESVRRMALSIDGSLYLTDTFSATINIGDSTLTSVGQRDIYLAKLDSTGQLQWTRKIGGTGQETTPELTTDSHGAVYISGGFNSSSLTVGTFTITSSTASSGNEDVFFTKYSAGGNPIFLVKIPSNYGSGTSQLILSADQLNNIHLSYYSGINAAATRTWFDSTGVQLGSQEFTGEIRLYVEGYKARTPTQYSYVSTFISLSGNETLRFYPFNSGYISGIGCSELRPAVNAEFDNAGNNFFSGRLDPLTFGTCLTTYSLVFTNYDTIPTRTGNDLYLARTVSGVSVDLYSTRNNGLTNEYPSRIAVDTSDHSIYLVGSWSKIADTSKFYFGNSVLTNAGNSNIADVLLLKFKYPSTPLAINAGIDKTICYGGSTTIGNPASGGTSPYTYSWLPATGLNNPASATPLASPTVTTDYVVTVTDALGAIAKDTVRVVVDSNLYRPTISIFSGTNPFCEGATLALAASPAVSYSWSTGATTQMITVNTSATLTVTALRNDGCIGTSLPFNAVMNPRTVTPTTTPANNASFCQGGSVTLTAQDSESPVNFLWTTGATTTSINVSAAGNYSVTATGSSGCASLPAQVTVTMNPTPTVNSISNRTHCNGDAASAINFSGTVPGTTYSWTSTANVGFGTGGAGNIPAYTATNTTTSVMTATVTVTPSANGCTGASTNFTVTVNPTPTINSISNRTHCNGDAATAINFSGTVPGTTYSWASTANVGFGTSGTGNISSYTATNSTSSPVSSTITVSPTANGCSGSSSIFTVTVNPTPVVNNISNKTYCNGDAGTAINFSGPISSTTYTWTSSANVGFGVNGTGNIPTFTANNATSSAITTTVTVTASANNCTGTATNFTVTVNPKPIASITQNSNVLTASPGGMSYQWYLNGSAITGATNQSITIASGAVYAVKVIDNSGCSDTTVHNAILRIVTTNFSYQVYPNPPQNDLNIVFTLQQPETVSIRIQSFDGRTDMLVAKNELQQAGEHNYTIRNITKRLQRGVYVVQFIIGDKAIAHKILIL